MRAVNSAELSLAQAGTAAELVGNGPARRAAIDDIGFTARPHLARSQLANRMYWITSRIAPSSGSRHASTVKDVVAAAQDVIDCPEFGPNEKMAAAVELTKVSSRYLPEAVELLNTFLAEDTTWEHAATCLATLGGKARKTAIDAATARLRTSDISLRRRITAAEVLLKAASPLESLDVEMLRNAARDPNTPVALRIRVMKLLLPLDGQAPLASLRDDPRSGPSTRWKAVDALTSAGLDLEAGARTLHSIAADRSLPAALRVQVLLDLMQMGFGGRDLAVELLLELADDSEQPLMCRARAACEVAYEFPYFRKQGITQLRHFAAELRTTRPRCSALLLEQICGLGITDTRHDLQALSLDSKQLPSVRKDAAWSLARYFPDARDSSATALLSMMRCDSLEPWTRVHAARLLAHVSDLLRDQAQEFLRANDMAPPPTSR